LNNLYTIIGGSGFIGSNLIAFLKERGIECYAPKKGDDSVFEKNLGRVIYCAGLTSDFRHRPYETVEAHVSLLNKYLQFAKFDSFLYLSSTRVYYHSAVANENSIIPTSPENPEDIFNISKLLGESLCVNCKKPLVRIARISNVIGEDLMSENFIFSILRDAFEKKHVELHSTLESSKDYISIDDVIKLLFQISTKGTQLIYNVASGKNTTNSNIIKLILSATDATLTFVDNPNEIIFPEINIGKIQNEFNFKPDPIEKTIHKLIEKIKHSHQKI
jgi:nucleoside-diphosphate-sugar epimerase